MIQLLEERKCVFMLCVVRVRRGCWFSVTDIDHDIYLTALNCNTQFMSRSVSPSWIQRDGTCNTMSPAVRLLVLKAACINLLSGEEVYVQRAFILVEVWCVGVAQNQYLHNGVQVFPLVSICADVMCAVYRVKQLIYNPDAQSTTLLYSVCGFSVSRHLSVHRSSCLHRAGNQLNTDTRFAHSASHRNGNIRRC